MSECMVIERCSRWGYQKWRVWVDEADLGWASGQPRPMHPSPLRAEGEYGTYAWTYRQALRKGRRLLRYTARCRKYRASRHVVRSESGKGKR